MNHIIRVLCESKNFAANVPDANTNDALRMWRGSSVVVQLALATNQRLITASEIGLIILEIKEKDALASDAPLLRITAGAANCDGSFTAEKWQNKTSQLVQFLIPASDTLFAAGCKRLIVRHESLNGLQKNTFLNAELRIVEDQSENASTAAPPPNPAQYVTTSDLAALVAAHVAAATAGKINKSGDTMTGALTVPAPTLPGDAANKDYVDNNGIVLTTCGGGGPMPIASFPAGKYHLSFDCEIDQNTYYNFYFHLAGIASHTLRETYGASAENAFPIPQTGGVLFNHPNKNVINVDKIKIAGYITATASWYFAFNYGDQPAAGTHLVNAVCRVTALQ